MFPFMEYEETNKFDIKLKKLDNFKDDIYATFFSYFEKTWFTCKTQTNKNKSKFPFSLWSYYEKLNSNKIIDGEISIKDFELYISFTNNFCESLNVYIKTFIPINQKISVKLFVEVIKNIFKRNSLKRIKNENLRVKKIPLKRNMSDIIIDILKVKKGKRIITIDEVENIKHHFDEEEFFDLKEDLIDNENEINNVSDNDKI